MPMARASICRSRATAKTDSQNPGSFASPFAAAPAKWASVRCRLFGLAEARAKAAECRRQTYEGIDPIEARRAQRVQGRARGGNCADLQGLHRAIHCGHSAGWRNAKHAAQWSSTLKTYAEPIIGALPVQSDRHRVGDEDHRAAVVEEAGNGLAAARPDRGRARLGDGARLSARRKSGALAWPSRQAVAGARQGAQGQAPCCVAL